jgi:hypothetical protein
MRGKIEMTISLKDIPPNFTFNVPYHPSVTEKDMRRATELLIDYQRRAAETRQQNVRAFVAALEQRRKKLRSLLGAEHHFALQQFKRELRLEAIKQLRPPDGLGVSRAELVRARNRRVTNFLSKRGIKPEVVRETVAHLLDEVSLRGDVATAGTIHLGQVELPPDPNPWVKFTPPFTGYAGGYSEVAVGYQVGEQYLSDDVAGQVGLIVNLDDTNSDDDDSGAVYADTQVSFWFQAPIAGLVEVIIHAQCGEGRHELRVEDQWGFSDSSTSQRHFLMMQVYHPNVRHPSYSLASHFRYDGDHDGSFNQQRLLPGQDVSAVLVSDGAVRAGDLVMMSAGCRTEDQSNANDMEIHSKSTFVWFLKSVNVRIRE